MGRDEFIRHVGQKMEEFRSSLQEKHYLKHCSHLDADGLSSAAIVVSMLTNLQASFNTSILHTLDEASLLKVLQPSYTHYVFSDLGSGQLDVLTKHLSDKNVLIIDHHEVDDNIVMPSHWLHINPRLFGLDGDEEMSGAGAAYFCAIALDESAKKLSYVALLGAAGDVQAKPNFVGMNAEILSHAKQLGLVTEQQSLNYFGLSTKSLVYLMEYSEDVLIPGVTGSKGGALRMLGELGINPELGGKPIRLSDLSAVEYKRLCETIIRLRRQHNIANPDQIYCTEYVINDQPKYRSTRTLKEFATLLNACGRMKKYSVGIGTCLRDPTFRELAFVVEEAYKQKISESIKWYKSNQHETGNGYMIINGATTINATIIGTLASIVSRQSTVSKGTFIFALARNDDGTTKVSVRRSSDASEEGDGTLNDIVRELCTGIQAQAGGHSMAAGAIFSTEHEDLFLNKVRERFGAKVTAPLAVATMDADIL